MDLKNKLLSVYKTAKQDDMYLYTRKHSGLKELPDGLRSIFGTPVHVMDILLTPKRKMGRVDKDELEKQIRTQGFYLQLPEVKDEYMLDLDKDTSARYKDDF